MSKIAEILKQKGRTVTTIDNNETAYEAIEMMSSKRVGSLVVLKDGAACGIVTERDYLRQVTLKSKAPKEVKVNEIMTSNVVAVDPEYSVEACMAIMTEKKFRHLPVFEDKKLVGLISIGDLVKQVCQDQELHINYLNDYITGKYPG